MNRDHANFLTIVADERDMRQVFERIKENLVANGVSGAEKIDLAGGVRDNYYGGDIHSILYDSYLEMFSGAPVPEPILDRYEPGLGARGMTCAAEGNSKWIYLDNHAFSYLDSHGGTYAFTIDYRTEETPNFAELDLFFMGLPAGRYEVAFYDAGGRNDYETIRTYCGSHTGEAPLFGFPGFRQGQLTSEELIEKKADFKPLFGRSLSDAALMATINNVHYWDYFSSEWSEAADEALEQVCRDEDGDYESYVDWRDPSEEDLVAIDEYLFTAIKSFPWVHRLDYGSTGEGSAAAERLLPGDPVRVVSEWIDVDEGNVCFDVYDEQGVLLGGFDGYLRLYNDYVGTSHGAMLACMLPYIEASIQRIVPASHRSKNVNDPDISVRFDLVPFDYDELRASVHELVKRGCAQRSLGSILPS